MLGLAGLCRAATSGKICFRNMSKSWHLMLPMSPMVTLAVPPSRGQYCSFGACTVHRISRISGWTSGIRGISRISGISGISGRTSGILLGISRIWRISSVLRVLGQISRHSGRVSWISAILSRVSWFQASFRDFRSDFKVYRPEFTDFMSDFKDFTPDVRYFRSDFKDYRNFRKYGDF